MDDYPTCSVTMDTNAICNEWLNELLAGILCPISIVTSSTCVTVFPHPLLYPSPWQQIVGLLSKLFYNNELICKTMFDPLANLPSISFVGVDGSESQDEGSPSYYNVEEAVEVARQVRDMCGG